MQYTNICVRQENKVKNIYRLLSKAVGGDKQTKGTFSRFKSYMLDSGVK